MPAARGFTNTLGARMRQSQGTATPICWRWVRMLVVQSLPVIATEVPLAEVFKQLLAALT